MLETSQARSLRAITAFTGSRAGVSDRYTHAVEDFARATAHAGYGLVFGGGNVGLMGVLADTALAAGGQVTGVMPKSMMAHETPHPRLTQLEIVADLHARKERMAQLGDAFVALPGGIGTLEEFFEAWTWQQLGIHDKPVALLNTDGFWDPLIAMLRHMTDQGFLREAFASRLIIEDDPVVLLRALETWQP